MVFSLQHHNGSHLETCLNISDYNLHLLVLRVSVVVMNFSNSALMIVPFLVLQEASAKPDVVIGGAATVSARHISHAGPTSN